jgi:DNA-binding CsgD family transcriptional regulator
VLEELGLDSRTEAVYRLMLTHPGWGVGDMAQHLRMPESEIRESLNRLADLTLLRQSLDAPERMHPVNPEVGLPLLLERQHAELLDRQHRLAKGRAAVSQLIADYATVRPVGSSDGAEGLYGMDAIQSRLEQLAREAVSVCLSFMPGGAQSARSLAASRPLDEQMLSRGVSVLTVYLASVRNDPATLGYARWLTELGGEVRTVPTLPLRMVMFDHKVALVPIDLDHTRGGAVQLSIPGAIAALTALFEQVWRSAVPFGEESKRADGDLTSQERELLRLLSQGLTDEVAARQLGISLRTERRIMSDIMRRLGARSRFEAGMRASKRRWISS